MSYEKRGETDEWYTPSYIFTALGMEFDMDVAHPRDHSFTKVPALSFLYEDALNTPWNGCIWMNPPFGNGNAAKMAWMNRFFEHGNGIALTPDRTASSWFKQCWQQAELVLFVSPKVCFIRADGTAGSNPSNGTVLWAMGKDACDALHRAAISGLGYLAKPAM